MNEFLSKGLHSDLRQAVVSLNAIPPLIYSYWNRAFILGLHSWISPSPIECREVSTSVVHNSVVVGSCLVTYWKAYEVWPTSNM